MNLQNGEYAGVPYDDIKWYDVTGQPFGIASNFNAIILGDADNIVDTKGAMAIGGNFTSRRGLSLGYGNEGNLQGTGYSPDYVRFLVGENVAMQGPLVVIGHVVVDGNFKTARGSTYMIGKDGSTGQVEELSALYQANGGSKYWSVSDREDHYAISSFDVPRYIPASRIEADTHKFFMDAAESLMRYHDCITALEPNGTVTEHYHEWILKGNDPKQNVFLVDVRPNGVLDKEIRFETPQGSIAIVIFKTGKDAHLRYGLWGNKKLAEHTIYVFDDAEHIHMEVPAAIWGSIFAPRAMFHAHPTGGTVSGSAALGSLQVLPTSGFEFHLYPFTGGVICKPQASIPTPLPAPEETPTPPIPEAPEEIPTPPVPEAPEVVPAPPVPEAPEEIPAPPVQETPLITPAPPLPEVPEVRPVPPVPVPETPRVMPVPPIPEAPKRIPVRPVPKTPEKIPFKPIPPTPELIPFIPVPEAPAPIPKPTPVRIQPIPIPIPLPCPEQEKCEECQIIPGVIFGCVWGCRCGHNHDWEVRLYRKCGERKTLLYCIKISNCGCFEFNVPYEDIYLIEVIPVNKCSHHKHRKSSNECKPMITLKNIGVANLIVE